MATRADDAGMLRATAVLAPNALDLPEQDRKVNSLVGLVKVQKKSLLDKEAGHHSSHITRLGLITHLGCQTVAAVLLLEQGDPEFGPDPQSCGQQLNRACASTRLGNEDRFNGPNRRKRAAGLQPTEKSGEAGEEPRLKEGPGSGTPEVKPQGLPTRILAHASPTGP
eukprot:4679360-Amphidinium_carterae.6